MKLNWTLLLLSCSCKPGYILKSSWFQAELLLRREPIPELLTREDLDEQQILSMELIQEIKRFGESIGLTPTNNYETVSIDWNRTVLNFSACEPDSFESVTWWFPIVGNVPYLGFFRDKDAQRIADRYQKKGFDVWVRPAGAYSTLGYFKDPVFPWMLYWNEYQLANTVLHELAHATLWIKGSVSFNETFASVIGDRAAKLWIETKYGENSLELKTVFQKEEDHEKYQAILHEMYNILDIVYNNSNFDRETKLKYKEKVIISLESRIIDANFNNPDLYVAAARKGPWNNARLKQYRTYNTARDDLEKILELQNNDIIAFISEIQKITKEKKDPYQAVREFLSVGCTKDTTFSKESG